MKPAVLYLPRRWIVWAVALFALTFALGFVAKVSPVLRFAALGRVVNGMSSALLDQVALLLDLLDRPAVVAVILVAMFVMLSFAAGWRVALGACLVTGCGWITALVVKAVVAQSRPTTAGLTHVLHVDPATLSYPSGHVVFAAAVVSALAIACRTAAIRTVVIAVGTVFVVIVAWSRLYLGVHYGTDVVGGVVNGVAGVLLCAGLWNLAASRLYTGRGRCVAD